MALTEEQEWAVRLYKLHVRNKAAEDRVRVLEHTVRELGENLADDEVAGGRLNADERFDFIRRFEAAPAKVVTELRDLQAEEAELAADAQRLGIDPAAML